MKYINRVGLAEFSLAAGSYQPYNPSIAMKSSCFISIRSTVLNLICGISLLAPLSGYAQTVVLNETFTGATYTGTSGSAGTGVINSTATWYSTNTSASGGPAVLTTDNTAPLSGSGLYLYGYANNSLSLASFSTVSLGLGKYIQVSYNYRSTTGTGRPFLGLYNDGGTPLTADYYNLAAAGTDLINDKGYNVTKTLANSSTDLSIYSETISTFKTVQFQTNNGVLLQNTGSGITGGDTLVHSVVLTLALQLNGDLLITAGYDGYTTNTTVLAANVLTTSFNEVVLGGYASASIFDNVVVTTGTVPEPTPMTAMLGGMILLGLLRFRSRSAQS